jgi:hypothetical protein
VSLVIDSIDRAGCLSNTLRNPGFPTRIDKIASDESEAWNTHAAILVHTVVTRL